MGGYSMGGAIQDLPNWQGVATGIGQAIQGGIQGYQGIPGQTQQGKTPGQQQGRGETPTTATQPPQVNTQAPAIGTGPIIWPHPATMTPITYGPPTGAPPGGWNTPTGGLPRAGLPTPPMSFKEGGTVPETGMYEVRGGEVIVPKKKVAKLHKGEKVLLPTRRPASFQGQFVGAYQEGGQIASTDQPSPIQDIGLYGALEKLKKAAPDLAKAFQGAVVGRQGAPQGGGAEMGTGAGVAFPGRVGQVPQAAAVPQFNMQPGGQIGAGTLGGPTSPGGVPPGLPPAAPGQPGGPASYSGGVQQPPYQSRFLGSRELNQYVGQNLLAGVTQGIIQYKQRQFDKDVNESQAAFTRQLQLEQERRARGTPMGAVNAGPGIGSVPMPMTGQPAQPAGAQPANRAGQGQPGAPGLPLPEMTNDERATYESLGRINPKLQQQMLKDMQRREAKDAKLREQALTDPNSAAARGATLAQQGLLAQQQQQASMMSQAAEAQAKLIKAQADQKTAEFRASIFSRLGTGTPPATPQGTQAPTTPPPPPGTPPSAKGPGTNQQGGLDLGTGDTLGIGTPWYAPVQAMRQAYPWTGEDEGVFKAGVVQFALGDDNAPGAALQKIYSEHQTFSRPHFIPVGNGVQEVQAVPGQGNTYSPTGPVMDKSQLPPNALMVGPGAQLLPSVTPAAPGATTGSAAATPAPSVSLPSLKGDTALDQTLGVAPPPVPAGYTPGLRLGGKIYKDTNILAWNPKAGRTGRWQLTSPREADQNGWAYQSKEVSPPEMLKLTQLENRLDDVAAKTLTYQATMQKPLSTWDAMMIRGAIATEGGAGDHADFTRRLLTAAANPEFINHLSPDGQKRFFAWHQMNEAMMGYNTVLAPGGKGNLKGLALNLALVPNPLLNTAPANENFRQLVQNYPIVAQGLPGIPDVPPVNDILSGKIPLDKLQLDIDPLPGEKPAAKTPSAAPGAGAGQGMAVPGTNLMLHKNASGQLVFGPAGQ